MDKIKKTFNEIKEFSIKKKLNIQYTENERAYYVFITDGIGTTYQSIIYKSDYLISNVVVGINSEQNAIDESDFLTNHKSIADLTLSYDKPKTDDNRDYIYTSSRPIETHTYFTSEGDDISSYRLIGGGTPLQISHKIGDPIQQSLYIDFNVIDNPTYIHEGYITCTNCLNDRLSFHFVPRLTSFVASQNTTFSLYNGYLIIPAAGDGNIQLSESPNLVCVGTDKHGMPNPGFWDADFSYDTGAFENIRPNPFGKGAYNIFGNEVIVYRMLQRIILKGSDKYLETSEHGGVLHGFRLKVIFDIVGEDHECDISSILVLYREKVAQMIR